MNNTPETAERRYQLFVALAKKQGLVHLLSKAGGFANIVEEESIVIPVWTDRQEAKQIGCPAFPGYELLAISLEQFQCSILPSLVARDAWVAVEPTFELIGISVPAKILAERFRDAV